MRLAFYGMSMNEAILLRLLKRYVRLLRRIYTGAHSGSNPNRLQTSDEPFCINDMKSDKMSQTTLSFVAVSKIETNFMRTGAERRR